MQKRHKQHQEGSYGALFPNQKRTNPKAPQMMGTLSLDKCLFEDMMNIYEETGKIEIQVSAWKNSASETGMPYLTLKAQMPFVKKRRFEDDDDENDAFQFLADL